MPALRSLSRKPLPKPDPQADPRFRKVQEQLKAGAAKTKAHPPARKKAGDAAAAAKGPPNERLAAGKAKQVDKIKEAKEGKPEPSSFLEMLRAEIAKVMPKTLGQTDNFDQTAQQVKGGLKSNVSQQTATSKQDVAGASNQAPAPTGEAKAGGEVPKEPAPGTPAVNGPEGMPAPKSDADVSLQDSKQDTDAQMKEAEVTPQQLQKANDPRFSAVLDAKSQVARQADAGPAKYRAGERATLNAAAAGAQAESRRGAAALVGVRGGSNTRVLTRQQQQKAADEKKRLDVVAQIEALFAQTKAKVDQKLESLDTEVGAMFDQGTEAALNAMTTFVNARIRRYKIDRYLSIPVVGAARWIRDQFLGLPDEVNAFYEQGRQLFQSRMDALVVRVAALVERRLKEAKDEVARGQAAIKKLVAEQSPALQKQLQETVQNVTERFSELERGIEDKKNQLAQSLAQKYKEGFDKANEALKKIQDENKGFVQAFVEKLGEVIKALLEFKAKLMAILRKGAETIKLIIADPLGFLSNLIAAVKGGIQAFVGNIWTHLKKGFMTWLFGALAGAGVEIPSDLSLPSILKLVLGVLGITYDRMRAKAVRLIGERNVKIIEKLVEYIRTLISGGPAALWEKVKEDLSNLKTMVIDAIQNWLIETVVKQAVAKIVSMFNPAGAIVQAIIAIYNIVMFVVEKAQQIMAFVEAVVNSVHAIATGAIGGAISWIEQALARTIPIVIGFLARLIGLGGISQKIKEFITKVQSKVDAAIDKAIAKIVALVKKLFGKGGGAAADPAVQQRWDRGIAEVRRLVARAEREGSPRPAVERSLTAIKNRYGFRLLGFSGGRIHAVMNPDEWVEVSINVKGDKKTFSVLKVGGIAVKVEYEGQELDLPAQKAHDALVENLKLTSAEAIALLQQLPVAAKFAPRVLLSFARRKGDPKAYLEEVLQTGLMRMDAVEGPVRKHTRDRLVNLGVVDRDDPESQRTPLSHYAIIFREIRKGQFKSNRQVIHGEGGTIEHTYTEWQYRDPRTGARADTQVHPLGVVEVGDEGDSDGVIVKIVSVNTQWVPGGKSELIKLLKGLGWPVAPNA